VQAVIDLRADQCPGCGEPLSESLHKEDQPDPKYVAHIAVCISCKTRQQAMEIMSSRDKDKSNVYEASRHWVMKRVE
jgi:hypothetical protein